jgi:hypothetical protein
MSKQNVICPKCQSAALRSPIMLLNKKIKCAKCEEIFVLQEQHLQDIAIIQPKPPVQPQQPKLLAWLLVHQPHSLAQVFPLYVGKQTVGRKAETSRADYQIETTDRRMSRIHIIIDINADDNSILLSDIHPNNGTWLNGKRLLRPKDIFYLQHQDYIQIVDTICYILSAQHLPTPADALRRAQFLPQIEPIR